MNLLLEKVPSLRHIKHSPTFFSSNLIRCHLSIWLIKCVREIMEISIECFAIESSGSNKDNESPTAILRKKNGDKLRARYLLIFPLSFIFKIFKKWKKEPYFYEITSFTPNGHLLGGFFFFFFSLVVSCLTGDLPHGSAGVCWCCGVCR